jgi:hypothetical protein
MSLNDFWTNVRLGARLYAPSRVISDSPRIDEAQMELVLSNADHWLTKSAVEGYDPNDFAFFPEQKRAELTRIVDQFRKVVGEVNPRGPVTEEQIHRARPLFRSIVEMLEFDRFADVDAFRVGNIVEAEPMFPASDISDTRYRTKLDSNDYPALKVMIYLTDTKERPIIDRAMRVREEVQELLFKHGQPYYPYVSIRLMSELAELPAVGADE